VTTLQIYNILTIIDRLNSKQDLNIF
jgi:hypothetical protein